MNEYVAQDWNWAYYIAPRRGGKVMVVAIPKRAAAGAPAIESRRYWTRWSARRAIRAALEGK